MAGRTTTDSLDVLEEALRALGAAARVRRHPGRLLVQFANGDSVDVFVEGLSTVRPGIVDRLSSERPMVVVAERVPELMRTELDRAGVGWLDRRGHLKFRHGGVWLDTDVPSTLGVAAVAAANPLGGPVAKEVAIAALVAYPLALPGVREVARRIEASPAGVSRAIARLAESGLMTRDLRAAVPSLFWAVTSSWAPEWQPLSSVPEPSPGLVAAGTRAALALGAPVTVPKGYPIELLAADASTLRRTLRGAPTSIGRAGPSALITLTPSRLAFDESDSGASVDGHRVAPVAVVAASIAHDPARGAEIVEQWNMPDRAW